MTRAEDRLIVCGYHGKRAPNAGTWHSIVSRALVGAPESDERPHPVSGEPVHRFHVTNAAGRRPWQPPRKRRRSGRISPRCRQALFRAPAARRGAAAAAVALRRLGADRRRRRSRWSTTRSPVLDAEAEPGFAVLRGLALHKLLQMLPGIAEAERRRRRRALSRARRRRLAGARSAQAALASVDGHPRRPRFRAAVLARLARRGGDHGQPRRCKGKAALHLRQDRPAGGDRRRGARSSTTRPTGRAPARLAEVPPAYVAAAGALPRAARSRSIPGATVSAALLFTEAPRLIELPAAAMDDALARLTRRDTKPA